MCGGGSRTTVNETHTGLGDDQYDALVENQGYIREDIASGIEQGAAEADRIDDNLTAGFADTQDRFDDVDDSLAGISGDMSDGFSDVLSGQEDLYGNVDERLTQSDENMATGFENLTNTVDTGVGTVNTNVDARAGEIQDTLGTRFDQVDTNLSQGVTDLTDTINTNDATILANQAEGFAGVGDQLTDVETNIGDQLTTTSENVLSGQVDIADLIKKYGGDAATYYADLAAGQGAIGERQGTLQTAFDTFREDYDDNTTLANQQRSELGQSIVGGFTAMGETLGNQAQATSQAIDNVQQGVADVGADVISSAQASDMNFGDIAAGISGVGEGVEGVGESVAEGRQESETNFASTALAIATGQETASAESVAVRNQFTDKLDTVRDILSEENLNIDEGIKSNYQTLVDSFDAQGNLIETSVDANGNRVTRALTDQGDLFVASFDANGVRLDQQSLDINTLLNNVTAFEQNVEGQFTSIFGDAQAAEESRSTILNAFETTNSLIGNMGGAVSEELSANFTAISNAFDEQGNLISNEIDASGNNVIRSIDENGNLFVQTIDDTNNVLSESRLDIADISQQLNNVSNGLGDQLATAFSAVVAGNEGATENIVSTLTSISGQLDTVGSGLSQEFTTEIDLLRSSFDDQGGLIRNEVAANGETIQRSLDANGNLLVQRFDATNNLIGETSLSITDISTQLNGVQSGLGDQLTSAFNALSSGSEDASASIMGVLGNIGSQIDQVGGGISQEFQNNFSELQNAFDENGALIRSEIDASGNEIIRDLDAAGNLITTRIDSTGEVLDQSVLNIADISQQLNQIQGGLGDQITGAFNGIQQSSAELKSNLVGNLAGLRDIMLTQGETLGGDLQEKFSTLLDSFDENGDLIRSSIDRNGDFVIRQIDENGQLVVNTVDDATGRLIEQDRFNAELLTQDFDARFNSTEDFLQAVDRSITELGDDFQQGLLGAASGLEEGFMSRFDELSEQERQGRNEFVDRLTRVKALLEEDVADLDDGLKNRMTALSQAFDGEGQLIADAIDGNGNLLRRQIDDQGNLILSTFSRLNGAMLDQQTLDINRLMNEIQNRSFTSGSNAMMGGRSPSAGAPVPASVYSGFASPYAQTF